MRDFRNSRYCTTSKNALNNINVWINPKRRRKVYFREMELRLKRLSILLAYVCIVLFLLSTNDDVHLLVNGSYSLATVAILFFVFECLAENVENWMQLLPCHSRFHVRYLKLRATERVIIDCCDHVEAFITTRAHLEKYTSRMSEKGAYNDRWNLVNRDRKSVV